MIREYVESSFITEKFQEFFAELLFQKNKALRLRAMGKEHQVSESIFKSELEEGARSIQFALRELLEKQSLLSLTQIGEFAAAHFQEALYVMTALADEIFLTLDWPGRKIWEQNLLEVQLFQTQIAGELFYRKLDTLIENHDPMLVDLATVYLWALGLGFRGKFQMTDEEKIDWYRQQLFQMIRHHRPTLLHPGRELLADSPYQYTISENISQRIPETRIWTGIFAGSLLVFLLLGYGLWHHATRDLNVTLTEIIEFKKKLVQ